LNPALSRELQACPLAESERRVLQDGKTKAVAYPAKGFNCNPYGIGLTEQKKAQSLASTKGPETPKCDGVQPFSTDLYSPYAYRPDCLQPPIPANSIESCPIDDKKHLTDGRTLAVPYPKAGYNCNPYGIAAQTQHVLSQCQSKGGPKCGAEPFKTELFKPYTYSGHCMNPPLTPAIEACPIDEREVLSDGRTRAVPYPKAGYNCNPYGSFSQKYTPKNDPAQVQQ